MKKANFAGVAMVMLLLGNWTQAWTPAGVCEIVNGSFEDDGPISDITAYEPNGWSDVNLPAGLFYGYVGMDWPTDGYYNLTIYSQWFETFEVNDIATVSQEVCLTDVNEIVFDVKLEKYWTDRWDPNKCTAVLLVDDAVVWESNSVGPDVRGDYYNQFYTVEDKYKDANSHKLSLGLRVNIAEELDDFYITQWDSIEFDPPCGGFDFLAADFNQDCYVNFADFAEFAQYWLKTVPPYIYDLFEDEDNVINELDLMVFADSWLASSYDEGQ